MLEEFQVQLYIGGMNEVLAGPVIGAVVGGLIGTGVELESVVQKVQQDVHVAVIKH